MTMWLEMLECEALEIRRGLMLLWGWLRNWRGLTTWLEMLECEPLEVRSLMLLWDSLGSWRGLVTWLRDQLEDLRRLVLWWDDLMS